jgi:hypothetical protein
VGGEDQVSGITNDVDRIRCLGTVTHIKEWCIRPDTKALHPASALADVVPTAPRTDTDSSFNMVFGGVQIRMYMEAVRFMSALCPKTTASTAL